MVKRPNKPPDRLKDVLRITLGEEAQDRKKHNNRPQPGDIRTSKSPAADETRLDRAIKKSYKADLKAREQARATRGQAGEIRSADSGPTQDELEKEAVKRFLRLAHERFKLAAEAEQHMRQDALDDLEFRTGKQWPKEIEMQRSLDGRPCLTMNRLPATIRQITNEQRQQRPAIQVNPVGDGADKQTAETLQGMVRHIEVISDAEIAYDTAFEQMVTQGFGYWRIVRRLIDAETNQQELYLIRQKNAFAVYYDIAAQEPCYEDAHWCFIIEDIPHEEYVAKYGDSEMATLGDFSSVGDNQPEWATRETVRVAEYFYVEGDIDDPDRKLFWAKINAIEILDGNESKTAGREEPGKYIPVIPVLGDDLDVNGKRHLAGLVRHAKDPQRMYNYWVSAGTEMIALAPKAPFVAAEGQTENHEAEWQQSNVRSFAVLHYKPVPVGTGQAPPPERQQFEPPVQAILGMTKQADFDFKTITGLFDPSLGQNKVDQSGKAIQLLQKQGDISNLNWNDNLARSIRHTGRVLIELIPKIYDSARIQRIIKPDQTVGHVIIHNSQLNEGSAAEAQGMVTDGVQKIFDLGVGRYDVTVSVGPSYQTKRQEAVASQLALVQAQPNAAAFILDLIVRNMDWPQSDVMADRIKKMLPPNLQDDSSQDPETKLAMAQSQLQQLSQVFQMTQAELQKAQQIIQEKQVEQQGKLAVEKLHSDTTITVAQINTNAQNQRERMKWEHEVWKETHGSAHELALQKDQQGHEQDMQESDAANALEQIQAQPKPKANGSTQ